MLSDRCPVTCRRARATAIDQAPPCSYRKAETLSLTGAGAAPHCRSLARDRRIDYS